MKESVRVPVPTTGIVLLAITLMACAESPLQPQATPSATTSTPTAAIAEAGGAIASPVNWSHSLGTVSAPKGWQVFPCDNPVLLCVMADGALIGTVERFSLPLDEVTLATAPPLSPGAEEEFLQAWVAEHYASIAQDRTIADRSLQFSAAPPTEISVGGQPGLRYGFRVTHSNGRLFDRAIGYVTTDGTMLHVFTTGVINGDPSGSFGSEADLEAFEPHLDQIIREVSL